MFSFLIKKYKEIKKEEKDIRAKNKFLIELVKKYKIKLSKKIKLKFILSFIIHISKCYFFTITIFTLALFLGFYLGSQPNSDLNYFQENKNLNQESFKNKILDDVIKTENLNSFEKFKEINPINSDFFGNFKNDIDFYYNKKDNKETTLLIKKDGEVLYLNHEIKEKNNFENFTENNISFFDNYNYDAYSTKYLRVDSFNKDSNELSEFYEKTNFVLIENNFFNTFLTRHFERKIEREFLKKTDNSKIYLYLNTYPLDITYTEKQIAAYEEDVKFYEFITIIYFFALIIFLISLYIPRGYYDFELIKQERDKFILKEANKKSNYQINELSYKNYKNNEINISEIKNKKNIISI